LAFLLLRCDLPAAGPACDRSRAAGN